MSVDVTPTVGGAAGSEAAPWVQLFQKAHQKIVLLERLDEQMLQMLSRREELQDELRGIQANINDEFNQRIKSTGDSPAKLLAAIVDPDKRAAGSSSGGNGRFASATAPHNIDAAVVQER
jgi:hypothetical protein